MTFSVVARDPITGDLGVAVETKVLAASPWVMYARAEIGAVATQAFSNISFGPRGLSLLELGASSEDAMRTLMNADDAPAGRQVAIIDAKGRAVVYTGEGCIPWKGHIIGDSFSCQGNTLVSGATIDAMVTAMEAANEVPLPERLVAALAAGQAAGGDKRGQQSAGLLVVRTGAGWGGLSDRLIDLRVDDHPRPIDKLKCLLELQRLHYDEPNPKELIEVDEVLAAEIASLLSRPQVPPEESQENLGVWSLLERWAVRENLKLRMVEPGFIDPAVLEFLRRAPADQSGN